MTQALQPEALHMPAWQPIAAAPKSSRTLMLGFFNESGKWRTTRGQWFTQEHIDGTWEDADDCKAGWYETPVVGEDCYPVAPTHWMPLPAAPGSTPSTAAPASPAAGAAQAVEQPSFDVSTSTGARSAVAWYFANVLHRHDFSKYIANTLAADFACALAPALRAPQAAATRAVPMPATARDEIQRLAQFADTATRMNPRDMRNNMETLADELTKLLALATVAPAAQEGQDARVPCKPIHPKGMTSVNAQLAFNQGWVASERHHGIRPADVAVAIAAQAAQGGA